MKKIFNRNFWNMKNILVICGIIVVIAAIVLLIVFSPFITNNKNKNNNKGNETTEIKKINTYDELEKVLGKVADEYYKNEYYPSNKEVIANFSEFGLNINLTSIDTIMNFDNVLKEGLKKFKCDYDTSKIHIYPEKPYGVDNYKIELELSCKNK